jgi:hypothetical protein
MRDPREVIGTIGFYVVTVFLALVFAADLQERGAAPLPSFVCGAALGAILTWLLWGACWVLRRVPRANIRNGDGSLRRR